MRLKMKNEPCKGTHTEGLQGIVESMEIGILNSCLRALGRERVIPYIKDNNQYLGVVKGSAYTCKNCISYGYKNYCQNEDKIKTYLEKMVA